jgi:hypothetical protein
MQRLRISTPQDSESPESVATHNMREADRQFNLPIMIAAAQGWLSLDKYRTYRDLELFLREQNMETHIIATKPELNNVRIQFQGQDRKWSCIFSCRPRGLALKEVLTHASSYKENLNRLDDTGCPVIVKDELLTAEDEQKISRFTKDQMDLTELLTQNAVKINIVFISVDEHLAELKTEHKHVQEVMIAQNKGTGVKIFAFMDNDELLSMTGYIVTQDPQTRTTTKAHFDLARVFDTVSAKK